MILYSKVTTAPESSPVSLDEAKLHLRVVGDEEDAYINSLIKVATRVCETYAGLSFMSQTRTVKLDRFRGDINLPYGPVVEVHSISYVDGDGVDQVINDTDYTIDSQSGLSKIRVLESWPYTNGSLNNVVVTYSTGYPDAESVPEAAKQAILMAVSSLYEHRGDEEKGAILNYAAMDLLDTIKVYWNAEY